MNTKLLISALLVNTALFAMHPLDDYTECQQPHIEKLRSGDSDALKKSIVECRAMLWNEDMTSYTNFNYNKFSAQTLTCAGDVHATEVLRGHARSLRYAATFYRLAATNGSEDAKVDLIYLEKNGNDVLFAKDTKKQYNKVFKAKKETPTFIQLMNSTREIKKEDRAAFLKKYQKHIESYIGTCVISLEKDLLLVEDEQIALTEIFSDMATMTYDENGNLMENKIDQELERHLHIWGNIEERNHKAQTRLLNGALKKYQRMQRSMSRN